MPGPRLGESGPWTVTAVAYHIGDIRCYRPVGDHGHSHLGPRLCSPPHIKASRAAHDEDLHLVLLRYPWFWFRIPTSTTMRATIASLVSSALLLTQQAAADWTYRKWNGANYACKCHPGDPCWPSTLQWNSLNATVGGNLQVSIPPAASCYNTFQGLLGNISTYNAAQCGDVQANYTSEQWQ